jgi:hypothetical protein
MDGACITGVNHQLQTKETARLHAEGMTLVKGGGQGAVSGGGLEVNLCNHEPQAFVGFIFQDNEAFVHRIIYAQADVMIQVERVYDTHLLACKMRLLAPPSEASFIKVHASARFALVARGQWSCTGTQFTFVIGCN